MDADSYNKEIARLLKPWVAPTAIPKVMRRPVEALGGRSLLQAARDGEIDAVRSCIASMFDLRRSQP